MFNLKWSLRKRMEEREYEDIEKVGESTKEFKDN